MRRVVKKRCSATATARLGPHGPRRSRRPGAERRYWYRFHAGDATSPIGRTRTLPRGDGALDRLRFAFASCQHYEAGFFTAYSHMADRRSRPRRSTSATTSTKARRATASVAPAPRSEIDSLEDYRNRYALYKTDPRSAGGACGVPMDRHAGTTTRWTTTTPATSPRTSDPRDAFLERRAAAYQAYYEHMPLRMPVAPAGPDMQLYRHVRRTGGWRSSRCSTRGSTGPTSRAATARKAPCPRRVRPGRDDARRRRRRHG